MASGVKGFVDLQVNGGLGISFTSATLTMNDIRTVTRALVVRGTLAYCPTVITGDPAVYRHVFPLLARAMRDPELEPHLLGLHLEGPFISPEPGAIGAHPRAFVQEPSIAVFERYQEWAEGHIRILTLAPERPGALELIRHATRQGVIVSLGHHAASDEHLTQAVAAGARLATHLGNGCPNMIHRHENPLWWQLACDELTGLFITDGHHLPADFLKVALRAKTPARFVVTSDASPLAGLPPGRYESFSGLTVTLDARGKISSEQSQSLAGSSACMFDCMNVLAGLSLLSESELWQVGLDNPARLLGANSEALLARAGGGRVRYAKGRFILKESCP